jgi:hypothetical protein
MSGRWQNFWADREGFEGSLRRRRPDLLAKALRRRYDRNEAPDEARQDPCDETWNRALGGHVGLQAPV